MDQHLDLNTSYTARDIQTFLAPYKLDAIILSDNDPFFLANPDKKWKIRSWATKFKGSAGTAVVTQYEGRLFVDSRYWVIAEQATKCNDFSVERLGAEHASSMEDWIKNAGVKKIGIDPATISAHGFTKLEKDLKDRKIKLVAVSNFVRNHYQAALKSIKKHREFFTMTNGEPIAMRLSRLRSMLLNCDAWLLISHASQVAWATGLRQRNDQIDPTFSSCLALNHSGGILFVEDIDVITDEIRQFYKDNHIEIMGMNNGEIKKFLSKNKKVFCDPRYTNYELYSLVKSKDTEYKQYLEQFNLAWNTKTPEEICAIRKAMLDDGIALCKFYCALDFLSQRDLRRMTEPFLAQTLYDLRARSKDFYGSSFEAIVAMGEHAALPHYRTPSAKDDIFAPLKNNSLLLMDTGGHYKTGTTDITRMTGFGQISETMRKHVTAVLKAHIQLAMSQPKIGTKGFELDALTRRPIQDIDLDYGHGTGHGVGFCTTVHDGYFNISPKNEEVLHENFLVSNEPGIYIEGSHGVRIESLLLSKKAPDGDHFVFETLTLCPIDTRIVDTRLLSDEEKAWLNEYHQQVYDAIAPHLTGMDLKWLTECTQAIA